MNIDLSDETADFGAVAKRAFEAAGGDSLVIAAERNPTCRQALAEPVLRNLGAWDLEPRSRAEDLEAAAALCRSAGYWALPYPIAERLARPTDLDADGLSVVTEQSPAAPLDGLNARWSTVNLSGRRSLATPSGTAGPPRKTAFVASLDLEAIDESGMGDVAIGLLLPCWTLLGMLDRALDLTRAHVLAREQFGQPLAAFQGVQFQLTDAEVERAGAAEQALYALWSVREAFPEAIDDTMAFRLATVEAAEVVFRTAHQLHGAIGFCDESPLAWLSRYSGPLRRLPLGPLACAHELARRLGGQPLNGPLTRGAPA